MIDTKMTEADVETEVADMCETYGLWWHHCAQPRYCHGPRGHVDMLIVGRHGVIFAELKGTDGKPSADQLAVASYLRAAGAEYRLVYPSDLPALEHALKRIA